MISQDDIDRGVVTSFDGRLTLMMSKHVRCRPFFVQYCDAPDMCMWEYWAPSSRRWVIIREMPKVGDTVCFKSKWPHPLFSQRGKVYSSNIAQKTVDASFPSGNHYTIDMKTLCIV